MLRAVTTNRAAFVRATCGSTPRGQCPSRVRLAAPPGRGGGADARGFRARARARARDLRKSRPKKERTNSSIESRAVPLSERLRQAKLDIVLRIHIFSQDQLVSTDADAVGVWEKQTLKLESI